MPSQTTKKASGFMLTNAETLSRTMVSQPNVQWLHAFIIFKIETFDLLKFEFKNLSA